MFLGSRSICTIHLVIIFVFTIFCRVFRPFLTLLTFIGLQISANAYSTGVPTEKSLREDVNLLLLLAKGRFLSTGFYELFDQSDLEHYLKISPCDALSQLADILSSSKPKQIPAIPHFEVFAASCNAGAWNPTNPVIFDHDKQEYLVYLINGLSHELTEIHHAFISTHLPPNSSIQVLNGFGKPQEVQIGPIWSYDKRLNTMVSLPDVAKLYWRSTLPPLSVSTFRIKLEPNKPFAPDIIPVIGGSDALIASLPRLFRGLTSSKPLREATLSTFATALRVDASSGIISKIRMQNLPERAATSLAQWIIADLALSPGAGSSFGACSGKLIQEATIFYRNGTSRRDLRMENYVLEPGVDPRAPFIDLEYSISNSSIRSSWRTKNKSDWSISSGGPQIALLEDSSLLISLFYDTKPSNVTGSRISLGPTSRQRFTIESLEGKSSRAQESISSASMLSLRSLMRPVVTIIRDAGKSQGKMIQPSSLMSHADPSFVKIIKSNIDLHVSISSVSSDKAEMLIQRQKLSDTSNDPLQVENAGIFRFGSEITSPNTASFTLLSKQLQRVTVTFGEVDKVSPPPSNLEDLSSNIHSIWTILAASFFAVAFATSFKRTQQIRLVLLIYALFVVITVTIGSYWT